MWVRQCLEPKGTKMSLHSERIVQWLQCRCCSPERPIVDRATPAPLFISCEFFCTLALEMRSAQGRASRKSSGLREEHSTGDQESRVAAFP